MQRWWTGDIRGYKLAGKILISYKLGKIQNGKLHRMCHSASIWMLESGVTFHKEVESYTQNTAYLCTMKVLRFIN